MNVENLIAGGALLLIGLRWAAQIGLANLNRQHIRRHANRPPDAHAGVMDGPTYARSVDYALARNALQQVAATWEALTVAGLLTSGILPWGHARIAQWAGSSPWAGAASLFLAGLTLAAARWPLAWYAQFRLEARFGFNTTTVRTWMSDRCKALALSAAFGYPLLALVLHLVDRVGPCWWLVAWAAVTAFQLLLTWLAPAVILPLFNRFTPLPDGSLRQRLLQLARRTGFRTAGLQVMDGSRRSRHANAFFTGFGRFRRIVLFDTLLVHLSESEVESVLAHEIGHAQRGHIRIMMLGSIVATLIGFALAAAAVQDTGFARAFGFPAGGTVPAFLVLGLLAGPLEFWLTPLVNLVSRRFEYEADRFAADALGESGTLVDALRKLARQNLTTLAPHPLFRAFYYSHPTLAEREQQLRHPR